MPRASPPRLVCPGCGAPGGAEERFCARCGMPLVFERSADAAAGERQSARRQWARKIKPQLSEGRLVRVVGARNQAEAEFIQGLLLEEGVPSLVRRTAGFDVPDFLAAGPRDLLVPESGVPTAREVLLEAELVDPAAAAPRIVTPWRLLAGLLAALSVGAGVAWLLSAALS